MTESQDSTSKAADIEKIAILQMRSVLHGIATAALAIGLAAAE